MVITISGPAFDFTIISKKKYYFLRNQKNSHEKIETVLFIYVENIFIFNPVEMN